MKSRLMSSRKARAAAYAVVATTTLTVAVAAPTTSAQASYSITNAKIGNWAKPWNSISGQGQNTGYGDVKEYGNDGATKWNINDRGANSEIRENNVTARCLDSNGAGDVYVGSCNGGAYQRWTINYKGDKYEGQYFARTLSSFEIRNVATGRCLDANGWDVYTEPCNGGGWQTMYIVH